MQSSSSSKSLFELLTTSAPVRYVMYVMTVLTVAKRVPRDLPGRGNQGPWSGNPGTPVHAESAVLRTTGTPV